MDIERLCRRCIPCDDLNVVDGPLVVPGTSMSRLPPAQLDCDTAGVSGKVVWQSHWSQELRRTVSRQRPPLNALHAQAQQSNRR